MCCSGYPTVTVPQIKLPIMFQTSARQNIFSSWDHPYTTHAWWEGGGDEGRRVWLCMEWGKRGLLAMHMLLCTDAVTYAFCISLCYNQIYDWFDHGVLYSKPCQRTGTFTESKLRCEGSVKESDKLGRFGPFCAFPADWKVWFL